MRFTDEELRRIAGWQPYRNDWPVHMHLLPPDDGVAQRYGPLLQSLRRSTDFTADEMYNGGHYNYIEVICYQPDAVGEAVPAIRLNVSLSAPVAIYGEATVEVDPRHGCLFGGVLRENQVGAVTTSELVPIAREIEAALSANDVEVLDSEYVSQELPQELQDSIVGLIGEGTILDALRQWFD